MFDHALQTILAGLVAGLGVLYTAGAELTPAEIILGILGAGGLGAILAFRKTDAEREAVSVSTLRGIIDELKEEVARNSELLGSARERIAVLENAVRLRDDIIKHLEQRVEDLSRASHEEQEES